MNKHVRSLSIVLMMMSLLLTSARSRPIPLEQIGDSGPPSSVVKLIFIHHSTGENWLTDGYGNLGETLGQNNYFVSDTNYGWGPDGIGDRTDIPDWLEWFRGDNTDSYFEALLSENGQHSSYTRILSDPGGENEIIMFKSCFPNSDLEGNPNDPPSADGWLSVGHAKYVYNELLDFFRTHPEKLFIVITAPPLSDPSNAANARAFNLWLVQDWLDESQYPLNNVAVFDFYNVLTGSDGHHTYQDGQEVHQVAIKDTLSYPSGDDHPSKKGSKKATAEFIPLLNYFYHRWQMDAPFPEAEISEPVEAGSPPVSAPVLSGLIDNFEGEPPAGTAGWEAYWDESTTSSLDCRVEPGAGISGDGLHLDYQISPHSWGTCGLYYDQSQDWSASQGLVFSIRSNQADRVLHIDLYVEGPEGQESYIYELDLTSAVQEEWVEAGITWDSFHRVDWEANAGSVFTKPGQISGLAFGFGTEDDELEGELWIDELGWLEGEENPMEPAQPEEEPQDEPSDEAQPARNLPCFGALVMPLGLVGYVLVRRKSWQ